MRNLWIEWPHMTAGHSGCNTKSEKIWPMKGEYFINTVSEDIIFHNLDPLFSFMYYYNILTHFYLNDRKNVENLKNAINKDIMERNLSISPKQRLWLVLKNKRCRKMSWNKINSTCFKNYEHLKLGTTSVQLENMQENRKRHLSHLHDLKS